MDEFRRTLPDEPPPAEAEPTKTNETSVSWLQREQARGRLAQLAQREELGRWSSQMQTEVDSWSAALGEQDPLEEDEFPDVEHTQPDPRPRTRSLREAGRRLWSRLRRGAKAADPQPAEPRRPHPDLTAGNLEQLSGAEELGQYLQPYYETALAMEPKLAEVAIRPAPLEASDIPRLFYARNGQTKKPHEVFVYLDVAAPELMRRVLEKRPVAKEHFAQTLGIKTQEMTPELAIAFGFLHELGHTKDYIENKDRKDAYDAERDYEQANLPVPNIPTGKFDTPEGQAYIGKHWDELQQKYGVNNIEELKRVQTAAHRKLTREVTADNFAATVIAKYRADRDPTRS